MASNISIIELIGEIETTILDKHYKTFNLLIRRNKVAFEHLITLFGDWIRELIQDSSIGDNEKQIELDYTAAGIAHCFRWLRNEPKHTLQLASNLHSTIRKEAAELLDWGKLYHELCLDHIAFR